MPFIPDNQPAIVMQPGEEALDLPSSLVPAERSSVLCFGPDPVSPVRSDHFGIELSLEQLIQRVAVVSTVSDQPLRRLLDKPAVQRLFYERDLMRRSTGCATGDRKTRAVCHCHDLGPFAPLGLPNSSAPFLAGAKVPSIKHSDTSSPPRSLRSWANAQSTFSKSPDLTQLWNLLWQVWYGGYRSGMSAHCAPVRNIQRMPSSTSRASRQGRPRRSSRTTGFGNKGSMIAHCSFVNSNASLPTTKDNYLVARSGPFMRWALIKLSDSSIRK